MRKAFLPRVLFIWHGLIPCASKKPALYDHAANATEPNHYPVLEWLPHAAFGHYWTWAGAEKRAIIGILELYKSRL
jgi:hypothetical protein